MLSKRASKMVHHASTKSSGKAMLVDTEGYKKGLTHYKNVHVPTKACVYHCMILKREPQKWVIMLIAKPSE